MNTSAEKVALVTGGNKGIGFELVRQLAKNGVRVILTARDTQRGKAAQAKLQAEGLTVDFLPLDVTQPASMDSAVKTLEERYGKLDILVNNAGILPDEEMSGLTVPAQTVREVFETNTLGPLQLSQKLTPLLKKGQQARIMNISSGLGQLNDMEGGYPAYRISKTSLNAVTRILAAELSPYNISVNAVCPGWVRTDMGGAGATRSPEESMAGILPVLLSESNAVNGQLLRDGVPIPW